MHSWARHLVSEAQAFVDRSYEYSSKAKMRDSDNEDSDDDIEMPGLMDADDDTQPAKPITNHNHPAPQRSLMTDTDTQPSHGYTPPTPWWRPFQSDVTLHPDVRNGTFKYRCDSASLSPSLTFLTLPPDHATVQFLSDCCHAFHRRCSAYTVMHAVVKPLVSLCLSHTNVNGLLGTGEMFLLSGQQFQHAWRASHSSHTFIDRPTMTVWPSQPTSPYDPSLKLGKLLDVGAGSGNVTAQLAPMFDSVTATEVSWAMCNRLRSRGILTHCTHDVDSIDSSEVFDCVLCFNVIDRCDRPVTLIKSLRRRLKNFDSRLLIATPLPLDQWVETGKRWERPAESLTLPHNHSNTPNCCLTWESSAVKLSAMFASLGLTTCSVSRVPYLSQGNNYRAFFTLDDALFVLKLAPGFDAATL